MNTSASTTTKADPQATNTKRNEEDTFRCAIKDTNINMNYI